MNTVNYNEKSLTQPGLQRYLLSTRMLTNAQTYIPTASQTFSKSKFQYPVGAAPLFADRAKGAYLWDVDGNKYVDLVSSLAAVTLGYANPGLNRAVKKQMRSGVIFSLPHKLEAEVAEKIVELVPSADMVRFGKNGSDATAAAIRIARAHTGKDHVIVCGYHGWQDWFIGSTSRDAGVPQSVKDLTHAIQFNDMHALSQIVDVLENKVAAFMLEPMNSTWPDPGYLEAVRDFCTKKGIVLIFDETITGFRFAKGGAQEMFKVTPDLSCFGKGLASGYPLAAITGRKDLMMLMEKIFFSGTFGGEALSLAAANYVLDQIKSASVIERIEENGRSLAESVESVIEEIECDFLHLSGHDTWRFLIWNASKFSDIDVAKTFFLQEMFKRGVLILGTHNVTTAFREKEIKHVTSAYREVLKLMQICQQEDSFLAKLECEPIRPLFKVR
jgi:glutamate-1-semialdehyde aminotransferase